MAALVIFKKYGDITTIHFLQLLDTIHIEILLDMLT